MWKIDIGNRGRFCGVGILRKVAVGRNATLHAGMAHNWSVFGCAAFVDFALRLSACQV
jgi:hypothetical protein